MYLQHNELFSAVEKPIVAEPGIGIIFTLNRTEIWISNDNYIMIFIL